MTHHTGPSGTKSGAEATVVTQPGDKQEYVIAVISEKLKLWLEIQSTPVRFIGQAHCPSVPQEQHAAQMHCGRETFFDLC